MTLGGEPSVFISIQAAGKTALSAGGRQGTPADDTGGQFAASTGNNGGGGSSSLLEVQLASNQSSTLRMIVIGCLLLMKLYLSDKETIIRLSNQYKIPHI